MKRILGKSDEKPHLSEDFDIELGPEWDPQHEDSHFSWADMVNARQILIFTLRARKPIAKPEYSNLALEQITMRQEIMRARTLDVVFGDPVFEDRGDALEFTVFGIAHSMPFQVGVKSIANANRIVVLTYFNYNHPIPHDDFTNESDKIRSLLQVFQ